MVRRSDRSVGGVAGGCRACCGGKQVKGAVYFADGTGNAGGFGLSFMVSANGKSIAKLRGPESPGCWASSTPPPSTVKISGAGFTRKMFGGSSVLSGRFLANGGVKGTYKQHYQCPQPPRFALGGPFHTTTINWSGTAEPNGKRSRYCFDHPGRGAITFAKIVKFNTTCSAVYAAMNAGAFTTPPFPGPFTTPGWTCTNSGPTYSCTKASARFTFTEQ